MSSNDDDPTKLFTEGSEASMPALSGFPDVSENYRILQRLGAGGMGEVFEAEQLSPLRRKVALKVIKPGMDTERVLARFESERQALARMDHPNIAHVFDAGADKNGRPYFAMEYVRGVPINEYCDVHRLEIKERLELLIQVCEGVQHAHQKGIIHRDIKPSNVLVTLQGDRPTPKIIDFGVAKAVEQQLSDRPAFTEIGQLVGTPEYMSPEQAEMTGLDIDTRSDVYSLGALQYKLLAGVVPFDSETLRSGGMAGVRQLIRNEEPPSPSLRLTKLDEDSLAEMARVRRLDSRNLVRRLSGDLDWITMCALAKDRTRRYGSPAEMAADLRRYLNAEPVLARPPSTLYKLGKFVRRHKAGVMGGSLILLAMLAGSTAATIGMIRATRAEQQAQRQAEIAQQVSGFLIDLFRVADPRVSQGRTISAREVLDAGAQQVESRLHLDPEIQSALMTTMGRVYNDLGLYDEGSQLLRQALEKRRALTENDLELSETILLLAQAKSQMGLYDAAAPLLDQALSIRTAQLGERDPMVAAVIMEIGGLKWRTGDQAAAESLLEEALEIFRDSADGDPRMAVTLTSLANVHWAKGDYSGAEELLREALDIYRAIPEAHPLDVAIVENNLALVLALHGKYLEAEPLNRIARTHLEAILGDSHPFLAMNRSAAALLLHEKGDFQAARQTYEMALKDLIEFKGEDHPDVADCLRNFAWLLVGSHDYQEALAKATLARNILVDKLPARHWRIAFADGALGAALVGLRRYQEAESLLVDSLPIMEALRPQDLRTRTTRESIVDMYEKWKKPELAAIYRRSSEPE